VRAGFSNRADYADYPGAFMNDSVLYAVADGVATITLNRPEVMNAIDRPMAEGLRAAIDRIEGDAAVRAVVIQGAGRAFMAGGDIKFFTEVTGLSPEERSRHFQHFIDVEVHPLLLRLRRMRLPVVARVHGAVAGFGVSLMLNCDLAYASPDTVFTLAYIRLGTSPDGGSTFFLPRHVGAKRAMEIALLGDRFDAEMALSLGLVNAIVPDDALDEHVASIAERLARGPSEALAQTKQLLSTSLDRTLEEQLHAEGEAFTRCAATADFVEGVAAFIAKRPPHFGGDRS
jgi:2-(1,2-epoxy-1,2-dihydrophenyl)acetyl-CoA isomerase